MLSSEGFDLWADGYDKSVGLCDAAEDYPFAGYKSVLNAIYNAVLRRDGASVLDVGFGTGTLTAKLYAQGCRITGVDFSPEMIRLAQAKMPEARLILADFTKGLPGEALKTHYDFVIASYSLHHLTEEEKVPFIKSLLGMLRSDGQLLVGDVAFENRAQLDACRAACKDGWDDEEFYFVYDEWKDRFGDKVTFQKHSFCAGILTFVR